jgi:hypothetical protein
MITVAEPITHELPVTDETTAPHDEAATIFTDEEYGALHGADRRAAAAIIGVMLSIFVIGVILYTVILFTVMSD